MEVGKGLCIPGVLSKPIDPLGMFRSLLYCVFFSFRLSQNNIDNIKTQVLPFLLPALHDTERKQETRNTPLHILG